MPKMGLSGLLAFWPSAQAPDYPPHLHCCSVSFIPSSGLALFSRLWRFLSTCMEVAVPPPPRGLFSVPWVECLNKPPPPQVGQPRLKIQPGGGHIGRHKGWPLPAAIVRGHMARRGSGWHCLEVMFQLQFRARNAQLGGGHTGAGTGIF